VPDIIPAAAVIPFPAPRPTSLSVRPGFPCALLVKSLPARLGPDNAWAVRNNETVIASGYVDLIGKRSEPERPSARRPTPGAMGVRYLRELLDSPPNSPWKSRHRMINRSRGVPRPKPFINPSTKRSALDSTCPHCHPEFISEAPGRPRRPFRAGYESNPHLPQRGRVRRDTIPEVTIVWSFVSRVTPRTIATSWIGSRGPCRGPRPRP